MSRAEYSPSHRELVNRVSRYFSGAQGCSVVMAERRANAVSEQPDVIGWNTAGVSLLAECKTSLADFRADAKKTFRFREGLGVGQFRFYAAPIGLLKPSDMPDGWGLLEVSRSRVRVAQSAAMKVANKGNEVALLVAAMRRLELSGAVFVRHEPIDSEGEDEQERA